MNNSIFGKCLEDKRKRRDVRLFSTWRGDSNISPCAEKYIASPRFKSCTIFNENLVAVELIKGSITFDKPIICGFSILELSKQHMYKFFYDVLRKRIESLELAYIDTDSLVVSSSEDLYHFIKDNLEFFDTSDFESDNIYGIPLGYMKVPGLFQDEMKGRAIVETICLRPKLYSMRLQGFNNEICKAKGVDKSVIRSLSLDVYKSCLHDKSIIMRNMFRIRSILHNLFTIRVNKVILSSNDDKRIHINNQNIRYAHGHYIFK
jgi:hypothetical protein